MKIVYLAAKMIIQKGLQIGIDINIEFTGLRHGEKSYKNC